MTDKEYFGGTAAKDAIGFSFNSYWKVRNYMAAGSAREYNLTTYPPAV